MSQIQKTSKQPSSTPHSIPNTPRTKHKRKREHDGDSGENIRKDEKRPKVLHNRSDGVESIQTQGAEVARAILSEELVNRQDALEAKSTRKSEIPANKLAKRERRKREREEGLISKPTQNLNGESHSQDPTKSSTNREEGYQKAVEARAVVKEKYKKEGLPAEPTWKVSEAIGGRFIDTEPLFSLDEDSLLLAKESSIEIYSTSTSLLVRSLHIGYHSSISGYAFSTTHHNILYVSTFSGLIYKWDWIEGKKIARWDISSQVLSVVTSASTTTESDEDIVYSIDRKGKWTITAHKLMAGNQASKTELVTLYRSHQPISELRVVDGGRILTATSGNRLMIGVRSDSDRTSLISTTYVWREVTLPEWITCFDVRVPSSAVESFRTNSEKPKSRKPSSQSSIDIVAGGAKGGIHIYRDLLERLIQKERLAQTGRALDLSASLHHWHREAVSTVKWSLDGNYIISGGAETVLVLWQLETSKKQFLPHLSSAIESLVVSAGGSSYALRLADNSAMVLSTSELKPTASIAGIQCRSRTRSRVPQPLPKTVDSSIAGKLEHAYSRLLRIPSAVNPLYPSQLLLAVSASQPIHSESVATNRVSFLQTFDFATTQHISRQALARTNTTALNIGPDGGKIGEPDVKYMRVSHDGQWLATVDEWRLPSKDLDFLSVDERAREEEQQKRQEVFLKFWSWNPEAKEWQLVTRVDSPHASTSVDGPGAGEVLTLATDPSALGFASLGEDGVVRVWRPKIRRRNGIEVRGKNAEGLISWHQHVIQLGNTSQQMKLAGASPRASIAWSEDGSLLAVSQQCSSADGHGVVHFIDAASGRIRQSRAGMYAGDLITMGIVDRYLIILSDQLSVWDMVDDELHFGLSLQSHRFSSQERAAATHLTVDQRHHTFALALPVTGNEKHKTGSEPGKRSQSQIAIFDPSEPTPLYTTLVPHMVTSLLPVSGSRGYIVLDSAAEVRILSPKSVPFVSNTAFAAGSTDSSVGLENVYGRGKTNADILKNDGNDLSDDESDVVTPQFASAEARPEIYDDEDAPVVSQQQLAGIFDVGSPFAMPPIDELFERVARLFAKKPRPLS